LLLPLFWLALSSLKTSFSPNLPTLATTQAQLQSHERKIEQLQKAAVGNMGIQKNS